MLAPKEKMPVRDELLSYANTICTRQFVAPINEKNKSTVWWGNTLDLDPGIGLVAYLDRPVQMLGFRALRTVLIAYENEGESSITVDRAVDASIFEEDETILRVRDIFAQHIGENGQGLVGRTMAMRSGDTLPHEYLMLEANLDAMHEEEMEPQLYDSSEEILELPTDMPQASGIIVPDFPSRFRP